MIHASQQYENAAAVIDNGQPRLASGLTGFGVFGAGLHPEMLDSGSDSFVDDLASYRSLSQALDATLDIDACNRAALTSQRDLLDALGGEAALAKLAAFNHTPVGS